MRRTTPAGREGLGATRHAALSCALVAAVSVLAACTADAPDDARSSTNSRSPGADQVDGGSAGAGPETTSGSIAGNGSGAGAGSGDSSGADGTTTETLPDAAGGPVSLGDLLNDPMPTAPEVGSAAARPNLIDGFPVGTVPVPAGWEIVSSSMSAEGDRLQVGLEASADQEPGQLTEEYVVTLAALGFRAESAPAVPGATATAFRRDEEGLVLTVRPRVGGGAELSIAGTLVVTS